MKTLVIVPCYNEQDNIIETCSKLKEYGYDYIVVNDGSNDDSIDILNNAKIQCIDIPINLGIGGAMQTGYMYAMNNDYDIAVQFDGDGQHDAEYIKHLIEPLYYGCDLVIGSRFTDDEENFKSTFVRRIGIKIISHIIKLRTGKLIKDTTSGFRAVNRRVMESFADSYPSEFPEPITNLEILLSDCRVREVKVKMHERIAGTSSIAGFLKSIYYMFNVILLMIIGKERKL